MEQSINENRVNSGELRLSDNPEPSRKLILFKPKSCKRCSLVFVPNAKGNLYCPTCAEIQRDLLEQKRRERNIRRRAAQGKPVGCGRGGNQESGSSSPYYKNGIGFFRKTSRKIRDEIRFCERCGKDLMNADRYSWCVHHIDRNRNNNIRENFMLLCKRCHQLEHNCAAVLPQNSGRCNDHPERE